MPPQQNVSREYDKFTNPARSLYDTQVTIAGRASPDPNALNNIISKSNPVHLPDYFPF